MVKALRTALVAGAGLDTSYHQIWPQINWRKDIVIPLYVLAAWVIPWPTFSFAGLCLLYLLQNKIAFTDDGLYWSPMAIFLSSLHLAWWLKEKLLTKLRSLTAL